MTKECLEELVWDMGTQDPTINHRWIRGMNTYALREHWDEISKEDLLKIIVEMDCTISQAYCADAEELYNELLDNLNDAFDYLNEEEN